MHISRRGSSGLIVGAIGVALASGVLATPDQSGRYMAKALFGVGLWND